jgi:hypothetical protein
MFNRSIMERDRETVIIINTTIKENRIEINNVVWVNGILDLLVIEEITIVIMESGRD